jgi:hypothetical protein
MYWLREGDCVSKSNRSEASTSPISSHQFPPNKFHTKNYPIEEQQNKQKRTFSNTQCKHIPTSLIITSGLHSPLLPNYLSGSTTQPVVSSHQFVLILDPFVLSHIYSAAPFSCSYSSSNGTPGIR